MCYAERSNKHTRSLSSFVLCVWQCAGHNVLSCQPCNRVEVYIMLLDRPLSRHYTFGLPDPVSLKWFCQSAVSQVPEHEVVGDEHRRLPLCCRFD